MEVVYGLDSFPKQRVPVVLVLGTFDGVHRGHRVLMEQAARRARQRRGRCAVLTFDPHPLQIIAPPSEPFLLTSLEERLTLLAGLGADLAVVVRFTEEFRRTPAEAWIEQLVRRVAMVEVVCGPNYFFGRNRGGTVAMLQEEGRKRGFSVYVTPQVEVEGMLVSSTQIRQLIRAGRVRDAATLLGRWYAIHGEVIRGDTRGKALGFPTANLLPPEEKVIPATGIYAAYGRTAQGTYQAAVSVGTRPTFGPGRLLVEAYLLAFSGTLYGEWLEIHFVHRLRDEIAFPSREALIAQMAEDVAEARAVLAEVKPALGESTQSSQSAQSTQSSRSL